VEGNQGPMLNDRGIKMDGLPHTITLMTTNRCTASCHMCGVGAGPGGSKRLSLQAMCRYIDEAAEIGVKLIVFSGGEPFLLGKDLDAAVKYAASANLFTRIVSNAYWAINESYALERLGELQQVGLCEVNFSTGKFHQKSVPIQNVINGTLAANKLGMICAIMIELHGNNSYDKACFLKEDQLSDILESQESRRRLFIFESPWVDVSKDASQELGDCHLITSETLKRRTGCTSIIGAVAIDPDERLGACCGITSKQIPELIVGNLKRHSLAELFWQMKRDFLKRWLFTQGPEHILAWAAKHDTEITWEGKYAHQCHVCYTVYNDQAVRAVVRKHYEKKFIDVNLQYWMMTKQIKREISPGIET
jgi:hypothetical protein